MKSSFPTLDQIKEVVKVVVKDAVQDEGKTVIAAFDKDVKLLEGKINSVDDKVENLRKEMNQRFNQVDKRFDEVDKKFDDNDHTHQQIFQYLFATL